MAATPSADRNLAPPSAAVGISTYLRLFGEMFWISLTVLGGGFAIIAAAEDRLSRENRFRSGKLPWLRDGELLDHLPLFQALPGIIAVHASVYIGRKVAGLSGALIAVFGAVLPSVAIFIAVSLLYGRIPLEHPLFVAGFLGLRAALTAVIASMVIRCWRKNTAGPVGYPLAFAVFAAVAYFRISAAPIILGSLLIGLLWGISPRLSSSFDLSREDDDSEGRPPKKMYEMAGLLVILLIFIKYGAIAFGGGYVLVPAYFKDFVGEGASYLQLAHEEFGNMLAMTQMTPGPIGINGATFFGYRLGASLVGTSVGGAACGVVGGPAAGTAGGVIACGVIGALIATFAVIMPGFIALNLALGPLAKHRGSRVGKCVEALIRPVTLGMMLAATWTFLSMCLNPLGVTLTVIALVAALSRRIGIVPLIILMAALSVALNAVFVV